MELKKGDLVKGITVAKEPIQVEGEIISVLEKTVIVSTGVHGNVIIKKCDLKFTTT